MISFPLEYISLQEMLILNCSHSCSLPKNLYSAQEVLTLPIELWLHEDLFKFCTRTTGIQACAQPFYGYSTNLNINLGAPCEEQAPQFWPGNLKPWLICVSSAWVAFWSKQSHFLHIATNTETINSKGFMKLLLRGRQRKTNWWVKWLMWKSQGSGKRHRNTPQVFNVLKENTNCTFPKCLDRLLLSFPLPRFHLNIFVVLVQTKTIVPEVSQETSGEWAMKFSCKWILDGSLSNSNITYSILSTKESRQ